MQSLDVGCPTGLILLMRFCFLCMLTLICYFAFKQERDPACPSLAHALLHFKGYQGLQVYRAANHLWKKGQRSLASIFHSRVSEVFGMDIHPAAQIGYGIMFDHGTGIVVGETAVIGNGCTLLHGVTLGGTGKQGGDRHPKLGKNVSPPYWKEYILVLVLNILAYSSLDQFLGIV
jgi:serine O-acetyltransferase